MFCRFNGNNVLSKIRTLIIAWVLNVKIKNSLNFFDGHVIIKKTIKNLFFSHFNDVTLHVTQHLKYSIHFSFVSFTHR